VSDSSSNPLRYAVVGLGRAGWDIHVRELRPRTDAKIIAVVDPMEQRRNEAAAEFGCKTYDSLAKMLKKHGDDVDVVTIATPSASHGPDTIKALKAGRHVVVEKPMALSLAEADRMIEAADKAGRKLFVHQNYRFNREFTHLEEVVKSGIIGRIFHVRMYSSGFARRNDWQTLAKNGGGVLNNTGPHYIDQILQLINGNVIQIMGDLQQIASAGDVEDHTKAFLRTDTGCTADMEISSAENVATALPKWMLCGTHGTLTMVGGQSTIRWFDPAQVPPLEAIDAPATDRRYGNADKLPWQEKTVTPEGPDVGNFYDNVYGVIRKGEPMRVTPQHVREVIRVIGAIRKGTKFPGKVSPLKVAATPVS
jgi:predicted dehydrogenase